MLTLLSQAPCLVSEHQVGFRGLRFSELTGRMLRKSTMTQGSERGGEVAGGGEQFCGVQAFTV